MSLRLCSRAPRMMSFSCTCESSISRRVVVRTNVRKPTGREQAATPPILLIRSLSRATDSRVPDAGTRYGAAMPDPQLVELLDSGTRRLVRTVDAMTDDQWAAAEPAARLDPRPRRRAPDPERRGAVRRARGRARGAAGADVRLRRRATPTSPTLAAAVAVRAARPVPGLDHGDRRVGRGAGRQPGRHDDRADARAGGRSRPARSALMRMREVEIHHADLGLDYTAADWPPEFVVLLLDSRADARTTASRFVAHATDLDRSWTFGSGGPTVSGAGQRSGMVGDRPGHRRRTDQRRRPGAEDGAVVSYYTGEVTPGGPPDIRELDSLTITKVAVDEKMSNNCYLLTCKHTGEQVLIDAADALRDAAAADRRRRADPRGHHPPALGPPPRPRRRRRRHRRPPPSPASPTPPRSPSRPASRSPSRSTQGDTVPVGSCTLEVIALAGHTPGSIALLYDDPLEAATRTCSPATRCSPAASATPSATPAAFAAAHRRGRRPRSSTGCPTTPGSTPATATTRPSAPSGRTSREWRERGW